MRVPVRRAAQLGAAVTAAGLAVLGTAPSASAVTKLTHAQAASQLSAAGVTWSSSGGCTTRTNSSCTSFEQINQTTVSGVITLKRASGCAINITGGTESGHASGTYSHWNGYKVDITKYTCIGNYIKNSFTYIGLRGDGYPQWKAPSGNLYCDEGNHWDITYYSSGG
ncbi:hypothetical protein [Luteipulveratus flavus]|uniref:Peptidoglycan-binding protein n=1 Tax=Luteipulveratus flavus TaxID=3031728 RepID=A0ABT6C9N5_9MICO|nr:hypothetical protein [Luteipulveratus sp. YIM 133296]MDF8265610.1 hypothetical protein [Luteipulveratus sp. YIM 133296]